VDAGSSQKMRQIIGRAFSDEVDAGSSQKMRQIIGRAFSNEVDAGSSQKMRQIIIPERYFRSIGLEYALASAQNLPRLGSRSSACAAPIRIARMSGCVGAASGCGHWEIVSLVGKDPKQSQPNRPFVNDVIFHKNQYRY
jgi:hypothetical protein